MDRIEEKARQAGFRCLILQTRPAMADAVRLYESRGYRLIPNYPPYDRLDGAVCYAKTLWRPSAISARTRRSGGAFPFIQRASMYEIRSERLTAAEYVEFLRRTDLGSQYPKERFQARIGRLLENASVSLTARTEEGRLVGVLLGLTDFAYWLFVTDLGVDRDFERRGIGTRLMRSAHALAGGEKDIAVYLVANEKAIPFYEKLGMKKAEDVMQFNHVEWTDFTVE
jgi:ribosomal protein S18 acetylase RimI-like enzyme